MRILVINFSLLFLCILGSKVDGNAQLVINEVMINPANFDNLMWPNTGEWTELFNNSSDTIDIGCYVITDGDWSATVPAGTLLLPFDFYTIGSINSEGLSLSNLDLDLGTCNCTSGNPNGIGGFSNGAEQVVIANPDGVIQDGLDWGGGQYAQTPSFTTSAIAGCPSATIVLYPVDSLIEHLIGNTIDSLSIYRECDGSSPLSSGPSLPTPGFINFSFGNIYVTPVFEPTPCSSEVTISLQTSGIFNNIGPYFYYWQDPLQGNIGNSVIVSDTGFYTVQVVDQSQCYYSQYFTIHVTSDIWIDTIYNQVSVGILEGEQYLFGSMILDSSGIYTEVFSAQGGCDSIVTLTLTVMPNITCSITANQLTTCQVEGVELMIELNNVSSVLPVNLQQGLVAYYPFDGNAEDQSGNNNDGVVSGASLSTDRFNQQNSAYEFSGYGQNDHIRVENSPSLMFTNSATFSLWYLDIPGNGMDGNGNLSVNQGRKILFSKEGDGYGTPPGVFGQILQEGGTDHLAYFSTLGCCNSPSLNEFYSNFSASVENNAQWKHATYVIYPDSFQIFIDGEWQFTKLFTNHFDAANNLNLYFGIMGSGNSDPFWYPFNGKLDDIAIYNRALSQDEIAQLYNVQSISWSTGESTPLIQVFPDSTSIYSCTISNAIQSCTANIEIQVVPPPPLVIHNLLLTSDVDSVLYNNFWITTAGIYTFDFGCDSTVKYVVEFDYSITCSSSITDSVICQGEIVELNAIVNFINNPYPIGSVGPAGGIVFYDKGNDEGGWRYIEMAPEDISGTYQWGCYDGGFTGWGGLGDGQIMADSILASCTEPLALNACLNYNHNGYDDWFLPSMLELNYIYIWSQPFAFDAANLSTSDFYWTSTVDFSYPNQNAFGYVFASPNQGGLASVHPKSSFGKVRPIRYFSLIDYSWSTMDTIPHLAYAPFQSELLHCTMTLSNGQVCEDSVNVFVSNLGNENIEIIPMQNLLCSNLDSLGFYVNSLQGNSSINYTWMLLGQEIQTGTDTVLWILPNSDNSYYSSFDNLYLTVSASSSSISCLAMDSLLINIDTPVSWDMIISTISDWSILPGEQVQMELSLDTSVYFGTDYIFNWTTNGQVISNIQDTIFTFSGLQNNDVIACQVVSVNSCQDIYSNAHEVFVDYPLLCAIVPTDTVSCGADSIYLKVNLTNAGIPINDWYCTRDTISVSNSIVSEISTSEDIEFLRLNLEHSFHSDLEIKLFCPNGQFISVVSNTGPYRFLGQPVDDELFNEGIGWDYLWSPITTNGTLADVAATIPALTSLPSDFYSIQGSWDSLLGCPINGEWIIEICDKANFDQGYLFDWEIQFNSNNSFVLVEDILQFTWNNGETVPSINVQVSSTYSPSCTVVAFGDTCSSQIDLAQYIPQIYFSDVDLDGFGDPSSMVLACAPAIGISSNSSDCNDMESSINPSEIDICENGIDDDCSGQDLSCNVWGCMDPLACNFNVNANQSDSSCTFIGQVCDDGDIWTLNDTLNDQCVCSGYLGTFCEVFPIVIEIDTIIDNVCFAENEGQVFTSVSGGAGLYYVQWNTMPIQTTPFAINLTAGEYILTVTDTSGCSATITAAVSEPEGSFPIINGLTDVSSGENAQYSTDPCNSCEYVWSVSNGLILANPDSLTLNVLWLEAAFGAVYLTRIDSSGCQVQSHISVDISASGLSENKSNALLSIYPNPTRIGKFFIQTNGQDLRADMLKIFDITGKMVFQSQVVMNGNSVDIEFGDLATGMYLVMVGEERLRLIVE